MNVTVEPTAAVVIHKRGKLVAILPKVRSVLPLLFRGGFFTVGNTAPSKESITDCRPQSGNMFTEKFGTNQCMLNIREQFMRKFGSIPDDAIIESVLHFGTAEIAQKYLEGIKAAATDYVAGIFRKLREHEYNPDLMKLYVVGGGGCMIKNFGQYDPKRVIIKDDICATAKGYEYMAKQKLQRNGGRR